jgi:hypothetical protein
MTISYLMSRQREIHYSDNKMLLVKTYIVDIPWLGVIRNNLPMKGIKGNHDLYL